MTKKIIIVYGPFDEFHEFNRFNANLFYLKQRYHDYLFIVVVPYTAACIIDNADIVLTASTEYLKQFGANYPDVLNYMKNMERCDVGYGRSGFFKAAFKYVENNIKQSDDTIKTILYSSNSCFEYKKEYMTQYYNNGVALPCELYQGEDFKIKNPNNKLQEHILRDFHMIGENIQNNKLIQAFEKDRQPIKDKYRHLFKKHNLIVLTRNFKNKQPEIYNTPDIYRYFIISLINKGINIINVGFPPKSFKEININYYHEISDNLTYSEFLCLNSMANATLIKADSGGFSTHMATKLNLFLDGSEWQQPDLLYNYRIKNQKLTTTKLTGNLDNIINFIKYNPRNYGNDFFKKDDNIIIIK